MISYITESPFYKDRRNLGEVNSFFLHPLNYNRAWAAPE
ncbi:Type IV secretion system protein VirD4 (plasmid) [Sinorhizobium fredii CCBAU 25509]|nr:Type IV secretion system protein VirD4 [Sinorhizobium fredii CCBAU 83666]AWM29502.1 Type IV secretion system protein VirD4 [Sinorhizobium fredii CCBAU 25509]